MLSALGLLLTGCMGIDSGGTYMKMYDFDVMSSDWQEGQGLFEAIVDVPAITADVVRGGNVQVSRRYRGENNGADIWTPLPAMRTESVPAEGGGEFIFTTYIDYEWTLGSLSVFVTTSDLYTGERPADMSFRIIITR